MSALIFDFDGTVADSFEVAAEIFYELTGHQRITDPKRLAQLRQMPALKAAKELKISPRRFPRLLVQGLKMMHARMSEIKAFPQIAETLTKLKSEGHQLFIISTNSELNVRHFLRANKIEDQFDGVFGGAGIFSKGRTLKKAIQSNHLDHTDTFYIGDEARDLSAAKRANVRAVSVSWGYNSPELLAKHKPFALVRHPAELLTIFDAKQ